MLFFCDVCVVGCDFIYDGVPLIVCDFVVEFIHNAINKS